MKTERLVRKVNESRKSSGVIDWKLVSSHFSGTSIKSLQNKYYAYAKEMYDGEQNSHTYFKYPVSQQSQSVTHVKSKGRFWSETRAQIVLEIKKNQLKLQRTENIKLSQLEKTKILDELVLIFNSDF